MENDTRSLTKAEEACVAALKVAFPVSSVPEEDADFLLSQNTYIRYTHAADGNEENAKKRLEASIEWRKEWKPNLLRFENVKEAYISTAPMRLAGKCKAGRQVVLLSLVEEDSSLPLRERLNCMCYIMESFLRKGYGKITWIADFGDREKTKKDDKEKNEKRKQALAILDKHYPERLENMLLYRAPWYMSMLLAVVKLKLPANTRPKIINVGHGIEKLEKYVERSQLPEHIGGSYPEWVLTDLEEKLPPFSPNN